MTIFKNINDGKLYLIYQVTPARFATTYYEAVPYGWNGAKIGGLNKTLNFSHFQTVGSR